MNTKSDKSASSCRDGLLGHSTRLWRYSVCVAAVASMFAVMSTESRATPNGPVGHRTANAAPAVRSYPLWSVLPTRSFAILGEGSIRQTRWGVYVFRQAGKGSDAPACIEEVDLTFFGLFSTDIECGVPAPPNDWPPFTLTSASTKRPDSPVVGETVMSMMLGLNVLRVTLNVNPGISVKRSTRLLSAKQAAKAHVEPFRYLALGLARDVCLDGVEGFDADDHRVLSTPLAGCRVPSS